MIANWILFAALPLLVAPWFLDFAQEAKSLSLMAFSTVVLGLFGTGNLALPSPPKRVPVAILILAALSFFSVTFAPGRESALLTLRNEGLALLAALLLASLANRDHLPKALHTGAAVVAVLGIFQVVFDFRALTPSSDPGQFPGVTFGNRGLASLFVALGIVPGLELWRRGKHRFLVTLGLFAQFLFVVIAMTRAVWIGVAVALAWSAWLAARQRRLASALLPAAPRPVPTVRQFGLKLGILGALVLATVVGAVIISRNDSLMVLLGHRLDPANWLNNPRLGLWHAALTQFGSAGPRVWFLGFGPGAFQVLSPEWLGSGAAGQRLFLDAHNDPLQVMLEYGALGLGLRIGLIVAAGRFLIGRALDPTRDDGWFPRLCLANGLILLVGSLFFYPLHLPYFMTLFAFFLMAEPVRAWRLSRLSSAPAAATARWAACGLAIVLFAAAWRRGAIEGELHTYVKEAQPFFVKAATRARLEEAMQSSPVPALYLRLVESGRLRP